MKTKNLVSLHDSDVTLELKAIAQSVNRLRPLERLTLIIGHSMNVKMWPQNRAYLSVKRAATGELYILLGHHSEVKHIKREFRHGLPGMLGWEPPKVYSDFVANGWHKSLGFSISTDRLEETLRNALDDCHLTYSQNSAEHQELYLLPEESHLHEPAMKKLKREAESRIGVLNNSVEKNLRKKNEISFIEEVLGESNLGPSEKNIDIEFWASVDHRGSFRDMICSLGDGKRTFLAEKESKPIKLLQPRCGLERIDDSIASSLWNGEKYRRLIRAREEFGA